MFRFNGKHCDDFGVVIDSALTINSPQRRKDKEYVPFRDGYVSYDNQSYDEITLTFTGHITRGNVDEVKDWLKGKGRLYLDYKNDRYKNAEILNEVEITRITQEVFQIAVLFTCQPFDYLSSAEVPIDMIIDSPTQAHITLTNPGTYQSEPVIRFIGTGNAIITVTGNTPVTITGLTGETVIVNTPLDAVYSETRLYEANTTGKLPILSTGQSTITITATTITKATVAPNWRYL